MKISVNWLGDYVELPETIDELAARITLAGLEVEGVEQLGEGLDGIVVAQIVESIPHPNGEKLSINKVDIGNGQLLQIVCGAHNYKVGDKVPLAQIGTTMPGGMKIEQAKLRGVESFGMLCSARELGISEDHSGLLILDPSLKLGTPIAEALGLKDTVFEVNVTPNRGDCLSHIGVAREVAALTKKPLKIPDPTFQCTLGPDASELIQVAIEAPERCRRYAARIAQNVKIGPSPLWMQNRLRAVGVRALSNAVDITNYVMFECGQPLHAFDFDKVRGGQIIVRLAKDGEHMVTLDGKDRQLVPGDDLCICDAVAPSALAGVMGGSVSEISDTTKNILIESAWFEPGTIRRTARRHSLHSEASHRYERCVDPAMVTFAQDRTAQLLAQLAGAQILPGRVDAHPRPHTPKSFVLDLKTPSKVLGMPVAEDTTVNILSGLGFQLKDEGAGKVQVEVPSWRPDVDGEADCVEEVARTIGYSSIPSVLPRGVQSLPQSASDTDEDAMTRLRNALSASGLDEVINYSFVDEESLKLFTPEVRPIRLRNAIAQDMSAMCTSRIPGLIKNLNHSLNRQVESVRIYEIGRTYRSDLKASLKTAPFQDCLTVSHEENRLSGLIYGQRSPKQWGEASSQVDFYDLKGAMEQIFSALHITQAKFEAIDDAEAVCWLHPRSACAIRLIQPDGTKISLGVMGELHPVTSQKMDVPRGVFVFDLSLDGLKQTLNLKPKATSVPKYPAVLRDLAVVVDDAIQEVLIEEAIRDSDDLVESATLFDMFKGLTIPAGKKSLAFAIRYRGKDETLKDAQVNKVHEKILKVLSEKFGATLR